LQEPINNEKYDYHIYGGRYADSNKLNRGGQNFFGRQAFVEKVIEAIPVFPFDVGVARIYARVWASLVRRGFNVGSHDLIIAATALSLDYTVVTANKRDFEKIEGLRLEVR